MFHGLLRLENTELSKKFNAFFGSLGSWSTLTRANDLALGLYAIHVWGALGYHDIRQRYRRSILGPFWFTLSTIIYVVMLGLIYSTVLEQKIEDYNAYLGIGLIVWQYVSSCMLEGCNAFIVAAGLIKQVRMPLTIHVCRIVWRNLIILLHNLPVFIILIALTDHFPDVYDILIIPGLVVLFLTMVSLAVALGILCARFRDVLPIISNVIQVVFFLTPIMFEPKLLKNYQWIAELNPIYHLIEIIRAPIIGRQLNYSSWALSILTMTAAMLVAQFLMNKYRDRVTYWL